MTQSDDYFALVGLDPSCDDPAAIKAAVASTRGRCSQGATAGLDRVTCEQVLARLPEVEAALLDPQERKLARERSRHIRHVARETRLESFQRDLAMVLAGGQDSLTVPERDYLVTTHSHPDGPSIAELVALITVPVLLSRPVAPPRVGPLPAYEARELDRDLAVVQKRDLYEFLGLPSTAASEKIQARRQQLADEWGKKAKATAEKTASQALLGKAVTVLLDPAKRASYDATLLAVRLKPLQDAIALALLDGHLSAHEHAHLLTRARGLGLSAGEAESAIYSAAAAAGAQVEPAATGGESGYAPASAASGRLIATFGPGSAWVGRNITWRDKRLHLDRWGIITPADVLTQDRQGNLTWAEPGLREWVQKLAGANGPATKPAPSSAPRPAPAPRAAPRPTQAPSPKTAPAAPRVPRPRAPQRAGHGLAMTGAWLAMGGGLFIVLGSVLPWITEDSGIDVVTRNGMQLGENLGFSGDGLFTLLMGLAACGLGLTCLPRFGMPRWIRYAPIVAGLLAAFAAALTISQLRGFIDYLESGDAYVPADLGAGLWVLFLGCVLAVAGGVLQQASHNADAPPRPGALIRLQPVGTTLVWVAAFSPLVYYPGSVLVGIAVLVMLLVDRNRLEKAGENVSSLMLCAWLLPPAYIYLRLRRTNQSLTPFTVWIVCFSLALCIAAAAA